MKYLYPVIALFIVVLPIGIFLLLPRYLPIAKIICVSPNDSCSQDLQVKFKDLQGKSWQIIKIKVNSLIADNPEIKDYSLRLKLPNTMEVYLVKNSALFAIHPIGNNIYYLIDKWGVIIKIQDSNNLPFVDYNEKLPNVGEKINDRLFFALEIINDIYYSYQVRAAMIENDSLKVNLPDNLTVIFPLEGNKKALLGSFILIIDRLKASKLDNPDNLGKISVVDLRFKNPVLK